MTIRMIRAEDGKTADVHPDEVENWRVFGWSELPDEGDDLLVSASDGEPSDEDMRTFIAAKTGKPPHHKTGRAKLVEMYRALAIGDA